MQRRAKAQPIKRIRERLCHQLEVVYGCMCAPRGPHSWGAKQGFGAGCGARSAAALDDCRSPYLPHEQLFPLHEQYFPPPQAAPSWSHFLPALLDLLLLDFRSSSSSSSSSPGSFSSSGSSSSSGARKPLRTSSWYILRTAVMSSSKAFGSEVASSDIASVSCFVFRMIFFFSAEVAPLGEASSATVSATSTMRMLVQARIAESGGLEVGVQGRGRTGVF